MKHSELKQRIFNDLFDGLALLSLLSNEEIEEIAIGLADPQAGDLASEPMFKAAADVVRMAKE